MIVHTYMKIFFRARVTNVWQCFQNSFTNYIHTQNITLERVCDALIEPLFKFVDKYTSILGQVS